MSKINPAAGIAAELGAAIVPSVGEFLEKDRHSAEIYARQEFEEILRKEFGV